MANWNNKNMLCAVNCDFTDSKLRFGRPNDKSTIYNRFVHQNFINM